MLQSVLPQPRNMEPRVLVCVSVCLCFISVYGQVGSLCRANERLLSCGCPKTCKDPVPDCQGVCQEGCFCEEGQVRNATGHCVKLADCPPVSSEYKQDTTEPRTAECPANEEYRFCEPCNRTCESPNPVCPAQCARGCFCKRGLLRDKDGACVQFHQCSNFLEYVREKEKNYIEPVPYRFTCGRHQVYKECVKCVRSCSDPDPVCSTRCKAGCFCQDGLVKAPDGSCVKPEQCPQVEDCPPGEEYFSCGWCEPSCMDPKPDCPPTCVRGCLCKPPLLRDPSGACVSKDLCSRSKATNTCTGENEVYVCRYGCEPTCEETPCETRPRPCARGCTCKLGYVRNKAGKCVTREQCGDSLFIIML